MENLSNAWTRIIDAEKEIIAFNAGSRYLLTNRPNQWVKKRIPELKRKLGGKCSHRGCGEHRLSKLQFAHKRSTPISRTGPRGRKEKVADVAAHKEAYTLKCHKHHATDKQTRSHDARMRRLGRR